MLPEEKAIRRALADRKCRSAPQVWPEIQRRLTRRRLAPRKMLLGLSAALVFLLAAAALFKRNLASRSAGAPPSFGVSRVESRGEVSAAIVLQPDPNTLLVIAP